MNNGMLHIKDYHYHNNENNKYIFQFHYQIIDILQIHNLGNAFLYRRHHKFNFKL